MLSEKVDDRFPEKNSKPKRLDLQGIRGIAIISVIGFHFLPSIFPNGYVGVDQFFVLSGFLMCMLLRKSSISIFDSENSGIFPIFQWISNFYIRRLKRILPLYFLIILLALLAIYTIFPLTAIDTNVNSGKKAVIFMSNRVETDNENYFEQLSLAIDIFTHTWSLSVEVQFYLLVPFLYIFGVKTWNSEIFYYGILAFFSLIYSLFFCSATEAFNSVFARIWQFSIGMIVYLHSDSRNYQILPLVDDDEEEGIQKTSTLSPESATSSTKIQLILTIGILIISLFPIEIPAEVMRPLITVITGLLMNFPAKSEKSIFLESRILTFFGDISYSLYLIHWPIYAFWKLNFSHSQIYNFHLIIAFDASIILAIASFEFYEKWYLTQSNKKVLILSLILFSLNMGILYENEVQNWLSPPPKITKRLDGLNGSELISFEKAEEMNKKWSKDDVANLRIDTCEYENLGTQFGFCKHTGLNATTAKFKIMLIGNSWAANHAKIVYEECGDKATSMVQVSVAGCEPLYNYLTTKKDCSWSIGMFEAKVVREKPDYLFLISRFIDIGEPIPSNITKIEDDPVFRAMKNQLDVLLKSVKYKIFIMNQVPRLHIPLLANIVENVKKGGKYLEEFDKSLIDINSKFARLRYEKLVAECSSRCVLFDYKSLFFNETTQNWRFYDVENGGLTYITQGLHLSYHGLELIRPVISNVCKQLYK